jgi:glycosyltransferase involved in cell wall biosynthesis
VTFAPGDALLLLDSAWSEPERFMPVLRAAEESGAEVVGYVYDLIPVLYPDTCVPFMPPVFRLWLEHIVRKSHAIICISRATADDLIAFIVRNGLRHRPGLRIHYAHLGSDLDGENIAEPSDAVRSVFAGSPRPTFLMVGTLEPRKGHLEVLDAFDELWAGECDVALCLIGKPGWKMDRFVERLQSHPEFKKRLHWLERPCDAELDFAYRHAAALIQASHAEGFGLPLLEAARCGTPIVCSDIPVFREIVGDNATFFEPRATEALARVLRCFVERGEPSLHTPGCVRTWRDAAEDVVRVLGANPAYHIFA